MNSPLVGGTGVVGSVLAQTLVNRAHTVTTPSRSPGEVTLPSGVQTDVADATDSDVTVAASIRGSDWQRDRRGRGGD